jgi:uncharacterized protein
MIVIEAVKAGDLGRLRGVLEQGGDVHERDEHEWTPLCWAAGRGDAEMVKLLLSRGADVYAVGRDQRSPYLIAVAAGHVDAARILRDEERKGGDASQSSGREKAYCRAYYLRQVRGWSGWPQSAKPEDATDQEIVFIHQDFSVTRSMWHGEDVLLDGTASDWRSFCGDELGFAVPDDLDLIQQEKAPRMSELGSSHP